jgi:hypothetical protein
MQNTPRTPSASLDLQALLHPSTAFAHPLDVVRDPELTLAEKRSILASWAADACAIDAAPLLRGATGRPVRYDEIIDALQALDAVCHPADAAHAYKRRQRRRRIADWLGRHRRGDSGAGGLGSGAFG